MEKKSHILTDLKKQVLILKAQLDNIQKNKSNRHNRSSISMNKSTISQSSRFNTSTYDSTYLDKGVKKFPLRESKYSNLSQLISSKSKVDKIPSLSQYRRAQDRRTKENFSTQPRQLLTPREKSPNPLTGEGYSEKKKGIKTRFENKENHSQFGIGTNKTNRSISSKKHYPFYLCR